MSSTLCKSEGAVRTSSFPGQMCKHLHICIYSVKYTWPRAFSEGEQNQSAALVVLVLLIPLQNGSCLSVAAYAA
jgi:hypothetical protein